MQLFKREETKMKANKKQRALLSCFIYHLEPICKQRRNKAVTEVVLIFEMFNKIKR